jgi:protein phosphatase
MGGAASGEIASGMAGQVVLTSLGSAWSTDGALNEDAFAAALRDATETANSRIHQFARDNPEHRGMGTTATVAGLYGDKLFLAQVGDSRAYLVRAGQARQLTKDQSLMQRLVEAGELTQEEADASDRRNIILQALGPDAHVTVDLTHQQLRRGDILLLCSDGLSGLVRADEIAQLATHLDSVEALCHALVDRANERGGPDNITVIAARFDGPALAAQTVGDEHGYATFPLREDIDPTAETVEARVPQSPFRSDPTPRFGTPLPSAAALEEEFARARAAEEAAAMGAPDDIVEERRRRVQPVFLFLLVLGGVALLWMLYKLLFTAAPPH